MAWTGGKAKHTSFAVPTVSLRVHERIDPRTIVEAVRRKGTNAIEYEQLSLFHSARENPPMREAIEFYKHRHNWSNRLIAGDMLVLETKGRDDQQNQTKRKFFAEWVRAVNSDGRFGVWKWDVSKNPADIKGVLEKAVESSQ